MTGKSAHPATLAAQALGWTDTSTGAVVLPVHMATTFLRDPDNPSYDQQQALLRALEGGAASLVFVLSRARN
jgi:cystathionine gamma-synthase